MQYRATFYVSTPSMCCEEVKETFKAKDDQRAVIKAKRIGCGIIKGSFFVPQSLVRIDQPEICTLINLN